MLEESQRLGALVEMDEDDSEGESEVSFIDFQFLFDIHKNIELFDLIRVKVMMCREITKNQMPIPVKPMMMMMITKKTEMFMWIM